LEGLFFEFVIESTIGQILAIHELGVLALSQDAEFRWRFIAPDILTGWQITEENIRLSIMDSDYIELDKLRGRQL